MAESLDRETLERRLLVLESSLGRIAYMCRLDRALHRSEAQQMQAEVESIRQALGLDDPPQSGFMLNSPLE